MEKIGVFGGSFNPVHWGHLLIAETARDQFALDRVIWVPTHRPPHKAGDVIAFHHRLEMVQRSVSDHPAFTVSDLDARQPDQSYSIATLRALQSQYTDVCWYWIVGLDAFQKLPQWRSSNDLAAQCIWLVAPRRVPNEATLLPAIKQVAERFAVQSITLRWHWLDMPTVAFSSSLIRHYCLTGRSIRYCVPESVRSYIAIQNLYK
ncbi:nicotinate (nicotinamide) nucleotide adenylyltransferase [Leptolyngbya sp. FACHB-36]|uniref:nicotinate (nicotinamide) nucleotide adenylyltransferase n=1 Tax=Leptolyngbya sp. FACHB-36 TaxID=2692808 RepID=UPI001681B9C9|nr:nicotinate (nicotinamide) nucleotide adenylyltransferase [Leptolyngbya sp. FACHB-36]MBD2022106.1 nicotinate (nicotinamide) nucleotide adenylyltransferase [Leptolyngbya sp. FACHB-36]